MPLSCHCGGISMTEWQHKEYPNSMATLTRTKRGEPSSGTKPTRRTLHFRTRGSSLGLRGTTTPQLIEQLEVGLSFEALRALESNRRLNLLSLATLIGLPKRTLARRRSAGRLAPEESERLLRISNLFQKASQL